ncbi:unnamed protein product, partial [Symbiodinium sp. CCMP2456]
MDVWAAAVVEVLSTTCVAVRYQGVNVCGNSLTKTDDCARKNQHRKQASLAYCGKQAQQLRKQKDRERRLKTSPMPSNPALEIAAVEELQKLGFLNSCPRRCPHCRGTLGQWSVRNGAEVYVRCVDNDCRRLVNLLTLQSWLPTCVRLGRKTTPSKLLMLIRSWVATGLGRAPSAYNLARAAGMSFKPVKAILQCLQELESEAGRRLNDSLTLRGTVEVDATSLRCVRVYKSTKRFGTPVRTWLAKHPHTPVPMYWLLHLGAVQRSDSRKLVVRLLEHKVVPAAAKPPPEATAEILQSKLLDSVQKNATLMADGARSWTAAARISGHRGDTKHVSHSKAEFTKASQSSKTLGTQLLDRTWGNIKCCVPPTLASRAKQGLPEQQILQYVYQALWRRNIGAAGMLQHLGALAK